MTIFLASSFKHRFRTRNRINVSINTSSLNVNGCTTSPSYDGRLFQSCGPTRSYYADGSVAEVGARQADEKHTGVSRSESSGREQVGDETTVVSQVRERERK